MKAKEREIHVRRDGLRGIRWHSVDSEWEGRKCANRQNTGTKEPSFPPLWIACCGECQTSNEVKPSVISDVRYVSLTCDVGVRGHVLRCLLSQNFVYYFHGVRCCVCDVGCSFPPKFLCRVAWCSNSLSFTCSCDDLLKEFDDLFWWKTPQLRESNQVTTEDAGHQVKETKQEDWVENVLMTQYLSKWCGRMISGGEQSGKKVQFLWAQNDPREATTRSHVWFNLL